MTTLRTALVWLAAWAGAAAWSATVSRVDGELVEVRDSAGAQVGDAVEILTRLPGFEELAKVGSGRVVAVSGTGFTARVEQRSGALAVGQQARLTPRTADAPLPQVAPAGPPVPAATPAAGPGLEQTLNEALRQGRLDKLNATVGPDRTVTLRGAVTSAADKARALQITRDLARALPVKDQVFVVEP